MNLAINLKAHMGRRKMSLVELAKLTKVPKQTLHNWLSGAEPKSLDQVRSVAQCFDLSIEELCYGEPRKSMKVQSNPIEEHADEIRAGVFEVVLRRVKK